MRSLEQARIADLSDREILAIMADLNGDGQDIRTQDLATRILGNEEPHSLRCVTSRLAWMRRYGLVDKGEEKGHWSMSTAGKALRFAKLGRSFSAAITNTQESTMLELAHQVGERMVGAGEVAHTAMRRELTFQIRRRRR